MLLILAQVHLGNITCAQVQSSRPGYRPKMTEVEITTAKYSWLKNDSIVAGHSIVTVPEAYFENEVGALIGNDLEKVRTAVRTHLRLGLTTK